MEAITVPQKVYDRMEELKAKQEFVSNAFDLVSTIYCHDLHEWLYSPKQVNAEQSKWREKQFIKYFYGEVEIKPEIVDPTFYYAHVPNTPNSYYVKYGNELGTIDGISSNRDEVFTTKEAINYHIPRYLLSPVKEGN